MKPLYFKVAVSAALLEPLTYLVRGEDEIPHRGDLVEVPLKKRHVQGVVLGPTDFDDSFVVKPIGKILRDCPPLQDPFLKWLEWLAEYYIYPVGLVMDLAFPSLKPALRRQKKTKKKKLGTENQARQGDLPVLTREQELVLENLQLKGKFQTHLLHGVTGSGKSEIYLRLLAQIMAQGRQGLVLVPEIALTPQLIERFSSRFGPACAVLHSHLTPREKTDQWWSMVRGDKQILIGARSALFCPIPRLGLIVIDEEHEASFKQDTLLRYHARDAAIMLAKMVDCPIVLGSATPSLESWQRAQEGRYVLHQMKERVADRFLPSISVVDLRVERRWRKEAQISSEPSEIPFWLTSTLYSALQDTLQAGEQSVLFLNRRGLAQSALCRACGHTFRCPNCDISLTVHGLDHLICHYCDFTDRLPGKCPKCTKKELLPLGLGTELIQKDISQLFPEARVARADRDEINSREDLENLIRDMEERRIDILIGTQMIAKGLDFPGLTLVGLVMADVGFSLPDFRSGERSFQLLTQVAGRSGRHSQKPGKVLIQTYNPTHSAIEFTCQHNFSGFAETELAYRLELGYPPFYRLAMLRVQGTTLASTEGAAMKLKERALALQSSREFYKDLVWLGPAPAPLAKLRNKFRFQALVKAPDPGSLRSFCRQLMSDESWLPSGVQFLIDVDPVNML